jgi:hypothetical protein
MALNTTLQIQVNNVVHEVAVARRGSMYHVGVDGAPLYEFKRNVASDWLGVSEDFPIMVDNQPVIVAVRNAKVRLAVNGYYIDTNEIYEPTRKVPKWYWVFLVLNVLIPVVSLGGALPFLLALGGTSGCAAVARSKIQKTLPKVLICIGITLAAWAVLIAMFVLVGLI